MNQRSAVLTVGEGGVGPFFKGNDMTLAFCVQEIITKSKQRTI